MTRHLSSADQILQAIKAEIEQYARNQKKVMIAFDLDSTLLETSTRMTQILRDFAAIEDMQESFARECAKLEQYIHHHSDWGIEHGLERIGLMNSPYEFFVEITKWWRKKFFSNEYLLLDQPLEGAVEFVSALVESGAHVSYITARETKKMWEGTVESLTAHGFYLAPKNSNLYLKKDTSKKDAIYKKDVLAEMLKEYGSVWFVENEPVNINLVAKELPQVRLIMFDTVHSGRELPPTDIASIKSFKFESR